MTTTAGQLTEAERLQVLSTIGASFQSAITQADGKVNILLIIYSGTTVVAASNVDGATSMLRMGGSVMVVAVVALAAFIGACAMSGYHLVQALRPRLAPPAGLNRFAFPSVSVGGFGGAQANAESLCMELGAHVEHLAGIAMVKNRHVRSAIVWLAILVVDVVGAAAGTIPLGLLAP